MNRISAIKTFFETPDTDPDFASRFPARKVEMSEMKNLTAADREELGVLCAEKLGVTLDK